MLSAISILLATTTTIFLAPLDFVRQRHIGRRLSPVRSPGPHVRLSNQGVGQSRESHQASEGVQSGVVSEENEETIQQSK
jgi:hypothetical protein